MRLVLVALLASMGCADERPPDAPPAGPSNPGTTNRGPDAAPSPDGSVGGDAGSSQTVRGTICHVTDLRYPYECPNLDLAGVTIRELGTSNSVTTSSDGKFSIELESSDLATLEVTAVGQRTSLLVAASGTNILAPLVPTATVNALLTSLGLSEPAGSGIVVAHLLEDGNTADSARVIPPNGLQPYYDTTTAPFWSATGPTGFYGAALMIGIPAGFGSTSFQAINNSVTVSIVVSDVPIDTGTITFVAVELGS